MLRLPYWTVSPDGNRAALALSGYLKDSDFDATLLDLLYLRVSQINGCTFCVDMHSRDLRRRGVEDRKLDSLVVWREAPFFSERERAALAWAEALTHLPETGAPDDVYEELRNYFADREIVDLTMGIASMNMLNRLAVGFRRGPAVPAAAHAAAHA